MGVRQGMEWYGAKVIPLLFLRHFQLAICTMTLDPLPNVFGKGLNRES